MELSSSYTPEQSQTNPVKEKPSIETGMLIYDQAREILNFAGTRTKVNRLASGLARIGLFPYSVRAEFDSTTIQDPELKLFIAAKVRTPERNNRMIGAQIVSLEGENKDRPETTIHIVEWNPNKQDWEPLISFNYPANPQDYTIQVMLNAGMYSTAMNYMDFINSEHINDERKSDVLVSTKTLQAIIDKYETDKAKNGESTV